jgi:RNA polymerase sigma factor (sigma-70 family)
VDFEGRTMDSDGSSPFSVSTDEELMALFQETSSEQVYEELVRRHRKPIRRYIREKIKCRGASDCDDLTQEVMLNMFRYRQHYEVGRSFRSWLYAVASRVIWVAHKYENRKRRRGEQAPDYEFENLPEAQRTFDSSDVAKVRALVGCLPSDEQAAIDAVFFQGLSWREASSQMGIVHGTFCTTIRRAMQRLRKRFAEKAAA